MKTTQAFARAVAQLAQTCLKRCCNATGGLPTIRCYCSDARPKRRRCCGHDLMRRASSAARMRLNWTPVRQDLANQDLPARLVDSPRGGHGLRTRIDRDSRPDSPESLHSGLAHAAAGERAHADQVLARIEALPRGHAGSPTAIAGMCMLLNDVEGSVRWMAKAIEQRDPRAMWMQFHPWADSVRSDARYQALMDLMHLNIAD